MGRIPTGATSLLFGLDGLGGVLDTVPVTLVEGEIDALSLLDFAPGPVVSLPNGASAVDPKILEPLQRFARVYIGTDGDSNGNAAAAKAAAELGPEKCRRVTFGEHKDANAARRAGWGATEFREAFTAAPSMGAEAPSEAASRADAGEWEAPNPFGGHGALPFPVNELPRALRAFVVAVSEDTQTPSDLTAMLSLAAIATCVQGRAEVQVTPSYCEPLSVFVAVVAESGERKSSVMSHVTAPLYQWEQEIFRELKAQIERVKDDENILRKTKEVVEKRCAQASKPEERAALRANVAAISEELASRPPILEYPQILADDATPEALARLMAAHDDRMAILSPEGGVFEMMAGRYSNGVSNLDVYLKGHAGDPLRVERRNSLPITMNRPALTLGLAVQRDVIRGLASKDGFRSRGLIARFLMAFPMTRVGGRKVRNTTPIPVAVSRAYGDVIQRLLSGEVVRARRTIVGQEQPPVEKLTLTAEAAEIRTAFAESIEPRLGASGDLHHIADWAGKLAGAAVRIAGLLHSAACAEARQPVAGAISGPTMASAVRIAGEYLIPHAMVTTGVMGANPEEDAARAVWGRIQGLRRSEFTERDLHQLLRGQARFAKAASVRVALELVAERGYIKQAPAMPKTGAGRQPSPSWEVNPLATQTPSGTVSEHSEYFEEVVQTTQIDKEDLTLSLSRSPETETGEPTRHPQNPQNSTATPIADGDDDGDFLPFRNAGAR
ncbi:MAG: DUF3987 domain-containing protein [Myxococcales bacterium]